MTQRLNGDDNGGNIPPILTSNVWQKIHLLTRKEPLENLSDLRTRQTNRQPHLLYVETVRVGNLDIGLIRPEDDVNVNVRVPETSKHIPESISRRIKLSREVTIVVKMYTEKLLRSASNLVRILGVDQLSYQVYGLLKCVWEPVGSQSGT
jgi:hypothetical protein